MKIYIVIPAHNEEASIGFTLKAIVNQSLLPDKVVIVNDNSTDNTLEIAKKFSEDHSWLSTISIHSSDEHIPGNKVINAFYNGYETLDNNYDIICKFDADIILPKNYIEDLVSMYKEDKSLGIGSGLLYIKKRDKWIYESIASKDHVRGPIKSYRKQCFEAIGGLKHAIGWDTIDILLAKFYKWNVETNKSLIVKHLKPTGLQYNKKAKYLSGERWYNMRYGLILTVIASLKSAIKVRSWSLFINSMKGYLSAKNSNKTPAVTIEEGQFIRRLRWKGIKNKFF